MREPEFVSRIHEDLTASLLRNALEARRTSAARSVDAEARRKAIEAATALPPAGRVDELGIAYMTVA
jgi:hypothetical protein